MTHAYSPLTPSGKSAVFVSEDNHVNIQKLRTVGGGVNEIDLTPSEARALRDALNATLDREPVDFTPRPKAGA